MDRQKIEKAVDQMTLMDDDFMCQVFDENYEGVELVLGIILKQPDIKVTKITIQHEYRNLKKRSVKLDITATDSAGRVMDIEVQRDNDGADICRARYNSSMLDTRLLEKSQCNLTSKTQKIDTQNAKKAVKYLNERDDLTAF